MNITVIPTRVIPTLSEAKGRDLGGWEAEGSRSVPPSAQFPRYARNDTL